MSLQEEDILEHANAKSVPTRPGMGHANAKIGASRVLRWRYRHKLSPTNVLSAII